jgi:hypothetical protein
VQLFDTTLNLFCKKEPPEEFADMKGNLTRAMIEFGTAQLRQLSNDLNTLEDYLAIETERRSAKINEDKPRKPRRSPSEDIRVHLGIRSQSTEANGPQILPSDHTPLKNLSRHRRV